MPKRVALNPIAAYYGADGRETGGKRSRSQILDTSTQPSDSFPNDNFPNDNFSTEGEHDETTA
jgi:hypothetical protein